MFLTTNDKTEIIIERMLWGTYGKSGKDPFKLVPLVSCTTDHLENILKNIKDLNSYHKWTIETILSQRLTNKFINP